MPDVTTRLTITSDVDDVAHVHRLSRASHYGTTADDDDGREQMWAHLVKQPGRVTHVAEASGAVVGFVSALYVLPTHVGQGTGSRLHDLFEGERLRDEPGVLEVWAGNDRAIQFYRRRGWTPTGTTRPGPQRLDFVTYRLPSGQGC